MNLHVEFDEAPQRMGVDMGELYKIPGADGVSPTVELSKKDGVTTLTITDVNGTQSVEILDGKDGSGGGVDFETDGTLTLENGVLSVNTTDAAAETDPRPITAQGVYNEFAVINALLKTI